MNKKKLLPKQEKILPDSILYPNGKPNFCKNLLKRIFCCVCCREDHDNPSSIEFANSKPGSTDTLEENFFENANNQPRKKNIEKSYNLFLYYGVPYQPENSEDNNSLKILLMKCFCKDCCNTSTRFPLMRIRERRELVFNSKSEFRVQRFIQFIVWIKGNFCAVDLPIFTEGNYDQKWEDFCQYHMPFPSPQWYCLMMKNGYTNPWKNIIELIRSFKLQVGEEIHVIKNFPFKPLELNLPTMMRTVQISGYKISFDSENNSIIKNFHNDSGDSLKNIIPNPIYHYYDEIGEKIICALNLQDNGQYEAVPGGFFPTCMFFRDVMRNIINSTTEDQGSQNSPFSDSIDSNASLQKKNSSILKIKEDNNFIEGENSK